MSYLDRFPEDHREFVRAQFYMAYVFPERPYAFGSYDRIELALGPRAMKSRLKEHLMRLSEQEPEPKYRPTIDEMLETVDESDEMLKETKLLVDAAWKAAEQHRQAHPQKKKKKADPPTDKQLKFLKLLGCTVKPKTKAEASKLIEHYKNK